MKNVWTIASRQFRSYFNGPVAAVVLPAVLLFVGFQFWEVFFLVERASARDVFRYFGYALCFAAPALSMGLIADEKRSGTIELLITMPVRESEVIAGKFLGAAGLLLVLLLCSLPYPISVSSLGQLDWGPVVTGYIGIFLQGLAMLAIGTVASSFTDNQLVAFFVGLFVSLVLVMSGIYLPLAPPGFAVDLLSWISFQSHIEPMTRGVIDSRDVIYFLTLVVVSLLISFRALEARRWS